MAEKNSKETVYGFEGLQLGIEQYQEILESCVDAVIVINKIGSIQYFNLAAEKFFGYQRTEVFGKNVKLLMPDNYAREHDQYLKNYNTTRQAKVIGIGREVIAQRKDGSTFPILLTLSEAKVDGESVYTSFIKDITDIVETRQKQQALEEELRQNLEEMMAVQENLKEREVELSGQLNAINNSYALVEFSVEGKVLNANEKFLSTFEYSIDEIKGKHHKLFITHDYAESKEYKSFWVELAKGNPQIGEFQRVTKSGKVIWMSVSYTPVVGPDDKVKKVIKLALDVTSEKLKNLDFESQMAAVNKNNAVIEFDLDGNVTKANDIFLKVMGYNLPEIMGRHHQIFCDKTYIQTLDYKLFWENLRKGIAQQGRFTRYSKNGSEIYLQAVYAPVIDFNGKVAKIVKFATDQTEFTVSLKAVSNFLGAIKAGDLKAQLSISVDKMEGELKQMVMDNLSLRDLLVNIINEVNRVVQSAGQQGNLRERLKISGLEGSWFELANSINQLLISISEPVLELNKVITDLSMGDLTSKFNSNVSGDIGDMANALNIALGNLNKLLFDIADKGTTVDVSSQQLRQKISAMQNSITEVATAIRQMASGAQDQAQRTDESSKLVEGIKNNTEVLTEKASIINQAAEFGLKNVQNGLIVVSQTVEAMGEISESADQTSKSIEVLTQRSEEISRTLTVITEIASQTNLLALNAAIEAARAGDAGRGFAVVAEEIRKLAEDSRRSAVEIDKVIKDVQKDVNSATGAIDRMKKSVNLGNKATTQTEKVFQEILTSNNNTLSVSKEVASVAEGQKRNIEAIVRNIEKIVVVAEETAAGTQEVANSSNDLNNVMLDLSRTGETLAQIATDLNKGISRFKLKS